jgi:HK97 family phage major capsid protein
MASEEATRLRDERLKLWNEYKAVLKETEGRAYTVEEKTKIDQYDERLDAIDAQIKTVLAAETRSAEADATFNALEARGMSIGNDSPLGNGWLIAPDVRTWTEQRSGSHAVEVGKLHRGPMDLKKIYARTLSSIGNASATVPVDFYDQLISYLIEVSGVLQTGPTVLNTSGGETMSLPTVTTHPTASTAAQGGVIPSGDPSFAPKTLGAQKFGWQGSVPRELIDDTAVDLLGYLAMAAGRDLGNKFGSALLNGGSGITGGIIPSVSVGVTGGLTSAISGENMVTGGPTYENLIDMEYSIIAPYRQSRSCYWLAADQSIGQLRKLKDTVGRPIWEPSIVLGSPDLLLGKPLVADPFMPAIGAGNKSFLFGDFSQYFVRLVGGIRFERSDDFQFGNDLVTFRALIRGDGNLADPNSLRAFQGGAS